MIYEDVTREAPLKTALDLHRVDLEHDLAPDRRATTTRAITVVRTTAAMRTVAIKTLAWIRPCLTIKFSLSIY